MTKVNKVSSVTGLVTSMKNKLKAAGFEVGKNNSSIKDSESVFAYGSIYNWSGYITLYTKDYYLAKEVLTEFGAHVKMRVGKPVVVIKYELI
ncbi:hypothetical protein ALPS_212 [Bacillus phage ALPS]|nr:hypothetical protein ALPS_212 [Bacillus phage ALPS]